MIFEKKYTISTYSFNMFKINSNLYLRNVKGQTSNSYAICLKTPIAMLEKYTGWWLDVDR
jgi:hypothetical protein